jgi:hypothetical protein
MLASWKLLSLRVWDESAQKLIGYRRLRGIRDERDREAKHEKSEDGTRSSTSDPAPDSPRESADRGSRP